MQIGCSFWGGNEVILIRGGKLQAEVEGYNKGGGDFRGAKHI